MNNTFNMIVGYVFSGVVAAIFMIAWNTFIVSTFALPALSFVVAWAIIFMAMIPFASAFITQTINMMGNVSILVYPIAMMVYIIAISVHFFILFLFL